VGCAGRVCEPVLCERSVCCVSGVCRACKVRGSGGCEWRVREAGVSAGCEVCMRVDSEGVRGVRDCGCEAGGEGA